MRKVIFVGSPEGSSEESLARMDAAIQQIREAADALRAALAEDRLAEGGPCPCKRCDYSCEKRRKGAGMTREEIVQLAEKAGASAFSHALVFGWGDIERFVALVSDFEREECAQVCSDIANKPSNIILGVAITCADAIRARGQE